MDRTGDRCREVTLGRVDPGPKYRTVPHRTAPQPLLRERGGIAGLLRRGAELSQPGFRYAGEGDQATVRSD